jgi:hypothetical protein
MANTFATTYVSPVCWVGTLTGDGSATGPTIPSSTILATIPAGPLRSMFATEYADQAAMRAGLLASGRIRVSSTLVTTGNDATGERNQVTVDVDTDAVSAPLAEINFGMSDTTGQLAIIRWDYVGPADR